MYPDGTFAPIAPSSVSTGRLANAHLLEYDFDWTVPRGWWHEKQTTKNRGWYVYKNSFLFYVTVAVVCFDFSINNRCATILFYNYATWEYWPAAKKQLASVDSPFPGNFGMVWHFFRKKEMDGSN